LPAHQSTRYARDKFRLNNSQFGKTKSLETIAKLTKFVYVYKAENLSRSALVGEFSTVNCSKQLKMVKDTLNKYIKNGLPFKGLLFKRSKIN
jgi:hypothetical protein